MSLDRLIELREKIGDEPIIPNAEDKREAMEMLRTPEKDMELDRAIDPKYSNKFASATPSYLYKGGQPDLEEQAENVRQAGRYGDTELMHVTPEEARGLSSLRGGVTLNPHTHLPEAFAFLAPAVIGLGGLAGTGAAVGTGAALAGTGAALAGGIGPAVGGYTTGASALPTFASGAGTAIGAGGISPAVGGYTGAGLHTFTSGAGTGPSFFSSIGNFASGLWNSYKGLNPIMKGAVEGAFTTPIIKSVTGEPVDAEDVFAGAVVGATLGGVRQKSFFGADTPEIAKETVETASENTTSKTAKNNLFDTFLSKAKDTLTDPLALGLGGVTLAAAFSEPTQGSIEVPPRITTSFDPVSKRVARSPITIDPETGENRFTQESIIDRIVADEGENTGLGRQLTEAFEEEVDINAVKEGGIVSLSTGGGPGGRASTGHYGEVGPIGINTYNPHTTHYTSTPDRRGEGGYETPVVSPFEFPEVSPFRSNLPAFNIEDRLETINAPAFEPVSSIPISSLSPTGLGTLQQIALSNAANVAQQFIDPTVETAISTPSVNPEEQAIIDQFTGQEGGIIGLANGGSIPAFGTNTPVFEGRVQGHGDGMADQVSFGVVPQTPEDIPNTPDMALLSSDEYVIPADVVSMLGNGSSTAGSKILDQFNKTMRMKAHGTNRQQRELDAGKELSSLV